MGLLEIPGGASSSFWDENVEAFRETVVLAIRETTDLLLGEDLPPGWRTHLNGQLRVMGNYRDLADLYIARRLAQESGPSARQLN